jgi:RNA polymerase sigma factor (sigma-70 family)
VRTRANFTQRIRRIGATPSCANTRHWRIQRTETPVRERVTGHEGGLSAVESMDAPWCGAHSGAGRDMSAWRSPQSRFPDGRTAYEVDALGHLDALYRTALRLPRHSADAEDLVQDTFVKALRFADQFEQGTNLKAWLFAILHNTYRNRRRAAARDTVEIDSALVETAIAAVLVLALAGMLVHGLTAWSSAALATQIALDHAKCFTLFGGAGAVDVRATEVGLGRRYGWQIRLPEGVGPKGLVLVGARRCLYAQGSIAHLMYRVQGRPVSLFVLPGTVRPSAMVSALGHEAVIWSSAGKTFVLLGREPRVELERMAAYLGGRVG